MFIILSGIEGGNQYMLNTTMNMKDGELYAALEGRLDTLSSPGFEKEMEAYFGELTALTLDFEKLEYISSAGLRTILSVQQYMEENGYRDVKVINVNTTIRETFEVTGFMDMIDVE
jgi:anti-sigma B factor antagonist